jgi:hypothetical protein
VDAVEEIRQGTTAAAGALGLNSGPSGGRDRSCPRLGWVRQEGVGGSEVEGRSRKVVLVVDDGPVMRMLTDGPCLA